MFRKLKRWSVIRHDRYDEACRFVEEVASVIAKNNDVLASQFVTTMLLEAARRRAEELEAHLVEAQRAAERASNGYGLLDDQAKIWRAEYSEEEHAALVRAKDVSPVVLCRIETEMIWWFEDSIYRTDDGLTASDVLALALEEQNKRRLRLEKAHALQAMRTELGVRGKRKTIPQDVKVFVWQRDGGRCVECGKQDNLEFDHVIPFSMGGSNTGRNLQLLCDDCNRRKGATLG